MKGVSRCVVEIVEPQDESIERVLIFLKPDSKAVRLGRGRDAAEKYAAGLISWRSSLFSARARAWLIGAAAVLAAGGMWWLLH